MKLINRFLKTSAVYLFGKVAAYIISFFMLRFYTSNISPSAYGSYEYIYSLINVFVPALFLELWSGVLRLAIDKSDKEIHKVVSTTFAMVIPATLVYTVVYFLITVYTQWTLRWITYVFAVELMLVNMMMMIARAQEKNMLFIISGILGSAANAIVGFFCVRVLHLETEALIYAMIGNYTVQIVILGVGTKIWRHLRITDICAKTAKDMLRFCWPLLLNTILYYLNTSYYMNVVQAYLGTEVLGLFTASTKFSVLVSFLVSVFHLAWQELTFSISGDQNKQTVYGNGLNIFQSAAMLGTLTLLPLTKIAFPLFIGEGYAAAQSYIPAYYSTVYFTSLSGFLYNTLAAERLTIAHPITRLVSATINMILMYSLIHKLGIYAVIIGAVCSSAAEVLVLCLILKKKVNLFVDLKRILLFCALYIALALIYVACDKWINGIAALVVLLVGTAHFLYEQKAMVSAILKSLRRSE